MGSSQAKPTTSMDSQPRRLERLKQENGHVGNGVAGHRRPTGQRYGHREPGRLTRDEVPRKHELEVGNGDGQQRRGHLNHKKGDARVGGDERKLGKGYEKRDGGYNGGKLWKPDCEDELVDGWPKWLTDNVPKEVLAGLVPKSAESYDKLDKVGEGTYSNVYKARDRDTGKIVALKKVRFDTSEQKSIRFMAREIMILQKLDHPNIVKLEGLATSRLQYSLYLVFDFMQSDLSSIIALPEGRLTEPQIKCYMHQLLSGLQHCHDRGILHRDIKGSNLLIDKSGMLKIADFGLANYYTPNQKQCLTSRVVTLWYRAPELLLGATDYGVGIDLWSAGCLLAEMFTGRPIMPGRTEVEQLHRIFKLCGTPAEEYWKKLDISTTLRPPKHFKPSLAETFRELPTSSFGLLSTLLSLDPVYRGSAASALQNQFFFTSPLACNLSGLPVISKEDYEKNPAIEQIKHMNSKMRRRSRTYRERIRKVDTACEKPREDKELKVNGEKYVVRSDKACSTSSSNTSSGAKSVAAKDDSFPSPNQSSLRKLFPESRDRSNYGGEKINISNPPPFVMPRASINESRVNMHRLKHVPRRSSSNREFRNLNQREQHLGLIGNDD